MRTFGSFLTSVYIAWPASFALFIGLAKLANWIYLKRAAKRQWSYYRNTEPQHRILKRLGVTVRYASPEQSRAINARLSNCPSAEIASDRRHFGTPTFR